MAGARGASKGTIRWRPTSEQVMILEELFKGGIKSPTSHQVQKITARLKEHGKVESKNVFYWFQNHKAREKQKLRKKLTGQHQQMLQLHLNKEVVYYNIHHHPHPHFACGFLPFFSTQVVETQDNESSWGITWLPTDSDSDHHRRNRPLETLQLFPTTTAATRETTTTASTSSGAAATSASSNMSSSSRILISL